MATSEGLLRVEGVTKRFGAVTAVSEVDLAIPAGEFFALLGPSGCGKTTLMRVIAGFEAPDAGRVFIEGRDVTDVPPYLRPVNMMFQSYALFPHMSVEKNIGFGLVQEGMKRPAIKARVDEMLRLVQLEDYANRKPHQLSGGQRQRVALARALAKRPRLLLLDEPLAALDRKLREETQFELMRVQRELGTSFMVVTHDQDEAMVMAQRIAVMRAGGIEQTGRPREIYERPVSRYVASFIGEINLFEATVTSRTDDSVICTTPDGASLVVSGEGIDGAEPGSAATLAVRPERMEMSDAALEGRNVLHGEIFDIAYRGDVTVWRVKLTSGAVLRVSRPNMMEAAALLQRGQAVTLRFTPAAARLLLQ